MSSSDNVVRAAFTRKHIDIDEFLAVARIQPIDPPIMQPLRESPTTLSYPVTTHRFGVQRIDVNGEHVIAAQHDSEILLCTAGDADVLRRGQAALVRRGDVTHLRGTATVFRTWGTH
jgi:mannose-6-phosphate isomerase class I